MSESIGTTCVQGGYRPGDGEPRQLPIYQSTTWKFDTSEHMGPPVRPRGGRVLLHAPAESHQRRRGGQDRRARGRARRPCSRRRGKLRTSSPCSTSRGAGDHVVASSAIYGGTYNLLAHTMRRMGLECTFVAPDCTDEELEAAFRPNTKAVFGETIANPALAVLDLSRFAAAAHAHGRAAHRGQHVPHAGELPPHRMGCRHRDAFTTKYLDGHGVSVGGAIVDSGRFDWTAHADKFPRPHHAGRKLPWRGVHGALRAGRGVHHEGDGAAHARFRGHSVAAERVLREPGAGEPASAHGAAQQERFWRCRALGRASEGGVGALSGLAGGYAARIGAHVPACRSERRGELRRGRWARGGRDVHGQP